MNACPTETEREQYLQGALQEELALQVRDHLGLCLRCRHWCDEVQADEALLHPVRQAWLPELAHPNEEGPAQQVGQYKILRRLGSGGMGVVYEAEQSRPRRRVALKVLRPGFVSADMLRRFEFEAEILGRLDHPGIAGIYDAGTLGDAELGQPFFVMELVHGRPLLEHTEAANLNLMDRLGLFRKICAAVGHAHQKGIIHRDLKPANILISEAGDPKILDFGIARSVDADLQNTTLHTNPGQLIGTLPYMSPEQVAGDPSKLDVRSDIYSLGVVLYELLTGARPYQLKEKLLGEAMRIIQEQPPEPPSTWLRTLHGDLETITLKALEKEPERRYESVQEFSGDVASYLHHEPISARPNSAWYRLIKLAKRHRTLAASLLVILLVLMAGFVTTSVQWWRAERTQQDLKVARNEALQEAAEAKAVRDFLMKVVIHRDPGQRGSVQTVDEIFAKVAGLVDQELVGMPQVRAELHHTVGWALLRMEQHEQAEPHLQQAYELWLRETGPRSLDTARAISGLGQLAMRQGDVDRAETLLHQALQLREELGETAWHRSVSCSLLAKTYHEQGRVEDALRLQRRNLELLREDGEHPGDLAIGLANYGYMLSQLDLDEAARCAVEAVELARSLPEPEFALQIALVEASDILTRKAEFGTAYRLLQEAVEIDRHLPGMNEGLVSRGLEISRDNVRRAALDPELDAAASCVHRIFLAWLRHQLGADAAAASDLKDATALLGGLTLGQIVEQDSWLAVLAQLAPTLGTEQELDSLWAELLSRNEGTQLQTARLRGILGRTLLDQGELEEAELQLLDSHDVLAQELTEQHPARRQLLQDLAQLYQQLGDHQESLRYQRQAQASTDHRRDREP